MNVTSPRSTRLAAVLLGLVAVIAPSSEAVVAAEAERASPAVSYRIIDLTPGAFFGTASGINNRGEVVGWTFATEDFSDIRGFIYSGGTVRELGSDPSGDHALIPVDVNDHGDIAGQAGDNAMVLDRGGEFNDLGNLGGGSSGAAAISNSGWVVGSSAIESGNSCAFRWRPGRTMEDLGTLPETTDSFAEDVNDRGQIVGGAIDERGLLQGFFSNGRTLTRVGTLGGLQSRLSGINDRGVAVGSAETGTPEMPTGTRAVMFRRGKLNDLGMIAGATASEAWDINERGEAVGSSWGLDNVTSNASLFRPTGEVVDLNTTIPADSGWRLAQANAINNRGWIIGGGFFEGRQHAFLLIPTREGMG
jgi:probable HAF family extracellular repeat protein